MGPPSSLAFGPFVFHTLSRRLEKQGELVLLNTRATELLFLLLSRAGELVTKDELLQAAWGDRVVAENNLTVHMAALRRMLRGGGEAGDHIRTEHGRGYRFITPVEVSQADGHRGPHAPTVVASGEPDPRGISVVVAPVRTPVNDETSQAMAAEVERHLMVQLSREPDALVVGARDARYVLHTSVRPVDGDIQVIATIDEAASGVTIWADRFEHRHVGLSSREGEISSRLARAVVTELLDREAARGPSAGASHGAGAQHSTLRGWSCLHRELWVPQDLAEARQWFDRAGAGLAEGLVLPRLCAGVSASLRCGADRFRSGPGARSMRCRSARLHGPCSFPDGASRGDASADRACPCSQSARPGRRHLASFPRPVRVLAWSRRARDPVLRESDRSFSQPRLLRDLPCRIARPGGSHRGGTKVSCGLE